MDAMALLCHDHAFGLRPRPLVECSTSHDDGHALGSPIKEKAMAPALACHPQKEVQKRDAPPSVCVMFGPAMTT
jgi:hypothetical protein